MSKWIVGLVALCVVGGSVPAGAQTDRDAIEVMLSLAKTERKAIVAQNMQLTEAESEAFWPIYNEYADKRKALGERDVKLIQDYAANFANLTDEKAAELLKEAQSIDQDRAKARVDYAKKLRKALPATKVARAYQVESKIDAIIEFELARAIPLAE